MVVLEKLRKKYQHVQEIELSTMVPGTAQAFLSTPRKKIKPDEIFKILQTFSLSALFFSFVGVQFSHNVAFDSVRSGALFIYVRVPDTNEGNPSKNQNRVFDRNELLSMSPIDWHRNPDRKRPIYG
jgi:hypothetical protein